MKVGPFQLNDLIKNVRYIDQTIGNMNVYISNISTITQASLTDITFLTHYKYIKFLQNTKAGACILTKEHVKYSPKELNLIITSNPQLVYLQLIDKFYPKSLYKSEISDLALVSPSAVIGKDCCICKGAIVGKESILGNQVYIGHNVVIGNNIIIGDRTQVHSSATIVSGNIGNDCVIYSGANIGQDGFGFIPGGYKIRHVGSVKIGNNVEIGANSCVDKGSLGDTVIKDNCKIDNLVQIGHNVIIGENTFVAAQSGISGSTHIGKDCLIGGQVGIAGHLTIGDKVVVAGKSGIINDIDKDEVVGGYPAVKIKQWHKQNIFLKKQIKINNG